MHSPTTTTKPTLLLLLLAVFVALGAGSSCRHNPFADYSITAVELRQAPKLEFLRAHRGMKFLQVLFDFKNESDETLVLRALDFSLRDAEGRHYPFSAQVLDMGQAFHTSESFLEADQIKSGSVVFQIPRKAVPAELVFRFEVEGGLVVELGGDHASRAAVGEDD